ncbi:MAG: hypothetical protein ABI091_03765 [Ferruginibacter sp.]
MKLTCKTQYSSFEPGEFTDIKQVNFETAVNVIENFPWNKEREHIVIDLTCPSVSFEYSPESILKLEVYFNNKYVLNFFDGEHLYSKSFTDYKLSYPFIEYFFEHQTIDFTAFKKENIWLKKIARHFITNDFIYTVQRKNIWQSAGFGTLLLSAMLIFVFINSFFDSYNKALPTYLFILLPFLILLYGGINWILLFNYYLYSKNKTLQISRGNNIFLWGKTDDIKEYKKTDIQQIVIRQNKGRRCPWSNFTLTFLYLKDGEIIKIPSILLDGEGFLYKLPGIESKIKPTVIPFCKLTGN